MSYQLTEVTIRTNNLQVGMEQIQDLWKDIFEGTIPVLFNSNHEFQAEISPVSRYSNYSSDENGDYDLTIMGAANNFFQEIEEKAFQGLYKKYNAADESGDVAACTQKAWEQVWSEQKSGIVQRVFTRDYECTIPKEFANDGFAHCCLYIAIQ